MATENNGQEEEENLRQNNRDAIQGEVKWELSQQRLSKRNKRKPDWLEQKLMVAKRLWDREALKQNKTSYVTVILCSCCLYMSCNLKQFYMSYVVVVTMLVTRAKSPFTEWYSKTEIVWAVSWGFCTILFKLVVRDDVFHTLLKREVLRSATVKEKPTHSTVTSREVDDKINQGKLIKKLKFNKIYQILSTSEKTINGRIL